MSLARIAIRGAYFTSIALALRQLISLCTTFYVARQLAPTDLGLFSMVMIVVGFAQVVGDIGIATGLVRSQDNDRTLLSTCFWIGAGIGSLLALLLLALAPWAGVFYGKPEMVPLLRASALGLLINFLLPVPMAMLQQRLAYKEISIAQVLGSFGGALATVLLVFAGAGTWALVLQPIVGNLILAVALLAFARWLPSLRFEYASAREIVHSGMHLLGGGLTSYARNNFDALVIGKSLLPKDLGIYSMAHTILYAPMHLVGSTVARVIFPLLAKLQHEPDRLREAVLMGTARTALLVLPIYFGLFVLADGFVLNIFGPQWMEMVPLLRILSLAVLIQTITNIVAPLMLALGKSQLMFRLGLASTALYFVVLLVLVPYGLHALAIGYTVTNVVLALVSLAVSLHFAAIPLRVYARAVGRPLLLAAITAAALTLLRLGIDGRQWSGFALLLLAGSGVYLGLVYKYEKPVWQQLLQAARG